MKDIILAILNAINDKAGVIFMLGLIACLSMILEMNNAETIITNIVSGLLGLTVGQSTKK